MSIGKVRFVSKQVFDPTRESGLVVRIAADHRLFMGVRESVDDYCGQGDDLQQVTASS
jgi:hypothetical protein